MQRLRLQIERLGPHFRTVLVRGEIGSGKELVARCLHAKNDKAAAPFVVCHASRLMEIEEEARDSDIVRSLVGTASEGTLFLDGIEEIAPAAQRRLLRILDQKNGLRTIASSSQDLRVMAAAGLFRQDVYHRLAMVEITIEPLRRRVEDIPALAMYFLGKFASQYEKPVNAIAADAMEKLLVYEWPGNVRELENALHNAVLQCEGKVLEKMDLSSLRGVAGVTPPVEMRQSETPARLQDVIDRHVLHILRECAGNKVRAAEMLGISRSTLYRMLEGCSAHTSGTQP